MPIIVNFNSRDELDTYIKQKTNFELLGTGSEGNCYRGNDNKAYKVFFKNGYREYYPIDSIITNDEINLDSFAFPDALFIVNGNLEAYTSKLVDKNLFDENHMTMHGIKNINFPLLIRAYEKLKKDTKVLTKNGIVISDLTNNILFDGKNLVAIDTCSYERCFSSDVKHNDKNIDDAIRNAFNQLFEDDDSEGILVNSSTDTISFLKNMEAAVKLFNKTDDTTFKTMR